MPNNVVAMVLVGGRGTRLEQITEKTAKPAVTFGGKYKLIDFVLSNLSNSFINVVGIVTQYEPHELMNYIQHGSSWDLDVSEGGIHFLTPYTSSLGEQWQRGTAHAIKQHLYFIDQYKPEYVLILSGDHVYKMDYNEMILEHQQSNADVTIAVFKPDDDLSRYGILELDASLKVVGFEEKPTTPKSDYASMGIYVFKKESLKQLLATLEIEKTFDFGKDIIPKALKQNYHIHGFNFNGYFRDVGTIESLYQANMDLLDHPEYLKPHDYTTLPLYTRSKDLPPHHIAGKYPVLQSMISDGCLIMGTVMHSILSEGVVVKDHAIVQDSVIFAHVMIGEHSVIRNAIVLENTVILPRTRLVFETVTVVNNETLWQLGARSDEK